MTRNQIEYNKLLEQQRANRAQEEIRRSRDAADIQLGHAQLEEVGRHNVATEQLQLSSLDETSTHNRETERISLLGQQEQQRHNIATESLTGRSLSEQQRSNQAREQQARAELEFSQRRQSQEVALEQQRQQISLLQEVTRRRLATVREAELAEQRRHNIVTEAFGAPRAAETVVKITNSGNNTGSATTSYAPVSYETPPGDTGELQSSALGGLKHGQTKQEQQTAAGTTRGQGASQQGSETEKQQSTPWWQRFPKYIWEVPEALGW